MSLESDVQVSHEQAFGCQGIVNNHQCPNRINAYQFSTCEMHNSIPQTVEHRNWLYMEGGQITPTVPRPEIVWRTGVDPRTLTLTDFCQFMQHIVGLYKADQHGNPDLALMYKWFDEWAREHKEPNDIHEPHAKPDESMDDLSSALASWQGPQANTRPNVMDEMTSAFQLWQGPSRQQH